MIITNIYPIYQTQQNNCQQSTSPNFVDYLQHELAKLNEGKNRKEGEKNEYSLRKRKAKSTV